MPPFIDAASLLLWLVAFALVLLFDYARGGDPPEKLRHLAAPLACVALPMLLLGWNMTSTWPLPGAANIIIGEPSLYFGGLLLVTACLIYLGKALHALMVPATGGGIFLLVLAIAIAVNRLGAPPASEVVIGSALVSTLISCVWVLGYVCVGLCAIAGPWIIRGVLPPFWRSAIRCLLWIAVAIFGSQAFLATLTHVAQFARWVPLH